MPYKLFQICHMGLDYDSEDLGKTYQTLGEAQEAEYDNLVKNYNEFNEVCDDMTDISEMKKNIKFERWVRKIIVCI